MAYIGTSPSQGVRHRYLFTATSGQTTFSGADDDSRTLSYTDTKFMDVFLNGVLLDPNSDYTATNGTSVVLTSGASAGDLLEVIAFDSFSVFSGTFGGDVTVGGTLGVGTSTPDATGLHVHTGSAGSLTPNAAADDLVIEGSGNAGITIATPDANYSGIIFSSPTDPTGAIIEYTKSLATLAVGTATTGGELILRSGNFAEAARFNSSGNLAFPNGQGIDFSASAGGNATSSILDDYEEGTWEPAFQNVATPTYTEQTGIYTKIGRLVHLYIKLNYSGLDTSDASSLAINLPYTASAGGAFHLIQSNSSTGYTGTNTLSFIGSVGVSASVITFGSNTSYDDGDYDSGNFAASGILHFAGVYITS